MPTQFDVLTDKEARAMYAAEVRSLRVLVQNRPRWSVFGILGGEQAKPRNTR